MATTASSNSNLDVSSTSIDNQRAQQLIERAMSLAERGELPSAVLSCRQSIALAPTSSQGHSMLGLLLERAGDSAGAIAAYEKVLQLAPDSFLERESLSRLRVTAAQRRTSRDLFEFDAVELFEDERPEDLPSVPSSKNAVGAGSTPALAASDGNESDAVSQSVLKAFAAQTVADAFQKPAPKPLALSADVPIAAATKSTAAKSGITKPAAERSTQAAKAQAIDALAITSASAAKTAAVSKTALPFPTTLPVAARNAQAARLPQIAPANADQTSSSGSFLDKVRQRPSFYFRGVPLAATSVLSLTFLLWAHNQAASRSSTQIVPGSDSYNGTPSTLNSPNRTFVNPNDAVANSNTNAVASGNGAGGTNGQGVPAGSTKTAPVTAARTGAQRPAANTTAGAPVATQTTDAGAPAAVVGSTPAAGGAPAPAASGDGGNLGDLPKPRLGEPPVADDTVRISASPDGSAPADGSGFVRVAPSSSTVRPVARPESVAAGDERAAGSSARSGDKGAAIDRMTRSIESGGGDTAFRYQQRAQLQMQNGDANSAINDYNLAIAAYNDMIARGEQVNAARAGIQTCQRGIQLAQARR